jgi:hypothetical protein
MLRRLILVGIFVMFERGSITQLVLATVFSAVYLLIQTACNPYLKPMEDHLANGCSFSLLVFFLCCIVFKLGTLTEQPNVQAVISHEQGRDFTVPSLTLSIILFACVLSTLAVSSIVLLVRLARERARAQRDAASKLPTCKWEMADGQRYVCFLSHYKVKAGAQARYLKDCLDRMLGVPAYLEYHRRDLSACALACSPPHRPCFCSRRTMAPSLAPRPTVPAFAPEGRCVSCGVCVCVPASAARALWPTCVSYSTRACTSRRCSCCSSLRGCSRGHGYVNGARNQGLSWS